MWPLFHIDKTIYMILLQFTVIKKIPQSLQACFGTQPPLVPHIANTNLSSATKTLFGGPETYGSPSHERVYVEDCSDKEDLEEEQLDFTILEDDCEGPAHLLLYTYHLSALM